MEWRNDILSFSGFGYGMAKQRVTGPCECHLEVRESSEPFEDDHNISVDDDNEEKNMDGNGKEKNKGLLNFYLHSLSDTVVDSTKETAVNTTFVEKEVERAASMVEIDLERSGNLASEDEEDIPISQMVETCSNSVKSEASSSSNELPDYLQDQSLPDDWKKSSPNGHRLNRYEVSNSESKCDSLEDGIEEILRSHQIDSMDERRIENEYFRDIEQAEKKLSQILMLKAKWAKMEEEGQIISRSCLKPKAHENPWKNSESADEPVFDKPRKNVAKSRNCVIS